MQGPLRIYGKLPRRGFRHFHHNPSEAHNFDSQYLQLVYSVAGPVALQHQIRPAPTRQVWVGCLPISCIQDTDTLVCVHESIWVTEHKIIVVDLRLLAIF